MADVPTCARVSKIDTLKITSASGEQIKIIGKVYNLTVVFNGRKYALNPYVTETKPRYIILGIDFILEFPEILKDCLPIAKNSDNKQNGKKCIATINAELPALRESIISTYSSVFNDEITSENGCKLYKHSIDTGNSRPFKEMNGRLPIFWKTEISSEIQKQLRNGIIKRSKSPWCSRIVPVRKQNGELRLCLDFRRLNSLTTKDCYPLPRIDEIFDLLSGAMYFSTLDATCGYSQILLNEGDQAKTAFSFNNELYEYTRMPFGLCNAPSTFQRAMNDLFSGEFRQFVIAYLDDVIIYSRSLEEHKKHLNRVFKVIQASGLVLNLKKCRLCKTEVKILGNIINSGQIKPDPDKISALRAYNKPNTIKEMRSFLGLANYIRSYIPNFAGLASPLFDLLKGESRRSIKTITWDNKLYNVFRELKTTIANITYRSQPNLKKRFVLTTDASSFAIGAILSQLGDNGEKLMISTFSKKLDRAQLNYSVTDKELLAVIKGIEYYRHYLLGRKFSVETDHKSLEFLMTAKHTTGRFLRWALKLQEYEFDIIHIKGEDNNADGLSRQILYGLNVEAKDDNKLSIANKQIILHNYHMITGHGSLAVMMYCLKNKFAWNNIARDVKELIEKCVICKKAGGANINTYNKPINTTAPNELWEIDLIGRLKTHDGNKFIFIAVDHYTKYVEGCVIANKNAKTIESKIQELIIKKHGIPKKILTDNGKEFRNANVIALCKIKGIEMIHNSPGHHETMGLVERTNQTVFRKLQKLCNYGELNWENYVEAAIYATNISFNRALQTSPYIFHYGVIPTFLIDKTHNKMGKTVDLSAIRKKRKYQNVKYVRKNIVKGKISCTADCAVEDKVLVYKERPKIL